MALRERLDTHRAGRRRVPARRHLRALPPHEGQRRAHGVGQRRARHPGDPDRRTARRDPRAGLQRVPGRVPRQLGAARHYIRPVHHHAHGEPPTGRAGHLLPAARQRPHLQEHDGDALLRYGQPLPGRPLCRGRVPALRLRWRAGRPVRQLRPHAGPARPEGHRLPHLREHPGVLGDGALLHPADCLRG